MLWFYKSFFPVVWIAFLLYWRIKAANTKTTHRSEPAASGILRILAFVIVIVLLSTTRIPLPWLYHQLWPLGIWPFWIGAAVTVSGLLFAIWARQLLGRNWSSSVTIKQGHELITTGPYALVRHPIYTGILTGFLGTAIALSQVRGAVGFVLIFLVLWGQAPHGGGMDAFRIWRDVWYLCPSDRRPSAVPFLIRYCDEVRTSARASGCCSPSTPSSAPHVSLQRL